MCLLIKCIGKNLHFNLDIGFWFKPERIKLLYQYRDVDRGIPIEDIDPIEWWSYFWYPVSRILRDWKSLKRKSVEGLGD